MINLPEPVAYRHTYDGYGYLYTDSGSGSSWRERSLCQKDTEPIYTEAQLKQLLRDFGEHIAKAVKERTKPNEAALEVIRALIKEIE